MSIGVTDKPNITEEENEKIGRIKRRRVDGKQRRSFRALLLSCRWGRRRLCNNETGEFLRFSSSF